MSKLFNSIIFALVLQISRNEDYCQAKVVKNKDLVKNNLNNVKRNSTIISDSIDNTRQDTSSSENNVLNLHEENFNDKFNQYVHLRTKKSTSKTDDNPTDEDHLIGSTKYDENLKQADILKSMYFESIQQMTEPSTLKPNEMPTDEDYFWSTFVIVNPNPEGQYDYRPVITIHSTNRCQPGEMYEFGECRIIT